MKLLFWYKVVCSYWKFEKFKLFISAKYHFNRFRKLFYVFLIKKASLRPGNIIIDHFESNLWFSSLYLKFETVSISFYIVNTMILPFSSVLYWIKFSFVMDFIFTHNWYWISFFICSIDVFQFDSFKFSTEEFILLKNRNDAFFHLV
jgi:hypothetical protein